MLAICKALEKDKYFNQLINLIDAGKCPLVISGLNSIHKAHYIAALRKAVKRPVFVIESNASDAEKIAMDIGAMCGEEIYVLPDREFTFYSAESVSRQNEHRRIAIFEQMLGEKAPVVVAGIEAVLIRTMPPEKMNAAMLRLKKGREYRLEEITDALTEAGYRRCCLVEGKGQFAQRGGILDFFSPSYDQPVRCEFWGDELDSIGLFDTDSQRKTEMLTEAVILPVAETLISLSDGDVVESLKKIQNRIRKRKNVKEELIENIGADIDRLETENYLTAADRYIDIIYDGEATAADYIPDDAIIILSEPGQLSLSADSFCKRVNEDAKALVEAGVLEGSLCRFTETWEELMHKTEEFPIIMMDNFTVSKYPINPKAIISIAAKRLPAYGGSLDTAAEDIRHYIKSGYSTVVLAYDERRAELLGRYLQEKEIPFGYDFTFKKMPGKGTCTVTTGTISAGFEYPEAGLAVISEGQLINSGQYRKPSPGKKKYSDRQKLSSYTDLSPGDLVVHEYHGIGRFTGVFKLKVDGVEKDYIKIAYAGTDVLYVPATQLDLVQKYIGGGEEHTVKLSKMGGADWQRTKSRAKGAAKEMARELIQLYAERQRQEGHAFSQDSPWQQEFEASFPYSETKDQLRCTEEIKADMEKPVPMDRLLCGDVGFGKTEVALRAVMKCVLDGYQAAILVPTTVLAQQHYATVMNRFYGYPVQIEVLSRFKTSNEIKQTLRGLENGTVDIVIGTHRLIQKDVKFKKLGLLVVDEEQRFGVSHKERLKEMTKQVDVLTLSATPIPRTLNMALSGIRDMSMIEEPPQDRQPVQTYVMEYDWGVIADAVRREVSRGGQVYYLHNRIDNIEHTAVRLMNALDGVSVAVAHGQMEQEELGRVMERVVAGDIQVLVCTTIIETGIDIPNVNTLIIEDADRLGLAQLHQIRGRVGRSSRRAFAYLTYRHGKVLTETAQKRLTAIREFTEFNSGFRIAMRDLEIRGAGNLLGAEQSGHMISVGYDMYLKLLEEAVLEEKGEKPADKKTECTVDLTVSANIPEEYIPSEEQRIDIYRRIAQIECEEDSDDIVDELIDRFGDMPGSVENLMQIALIKSNAAQAGITEITQRSGWIYFKFKDFDIKQISEIYDMDEYKGRIKIEAGSVPNLTLRLKDKNVIKETRRFVKCYGKTYGK